MPSASVMRPAPRHTWRMTARLLGGLGLGLLRVPAGAAQATPVERTATVGYLAGPTVYVKAGRDDGLGDGQQLRVVRADAVVATLVVQFLSSRQAACRIVSGTVELVVGDTVRFTARPDTLPARASAAPRPSRSRRGPGLHGRVGARYLVAEEEGPGGGFRQPSLDLRLDGSALGGTPVGLALDVRTRRTSSTRADGATAVDGNTRVYRAALSYGRPGSPLGLTVGRQYLSAVTAVSLFDGGLVELRSRRMTAGLFLGTEPTPTLGVSGDIREAGAFVQWTSGAGARPSWSLTAGGVGSYAEGRSNREFGFLQASLNSRTVSVLAMQEIDYYRPWKVDQGETSWSLTSSYLSGSLRPARWLSVHAAWDSRRRVRLYRDATNPALAFDDAYRQGASGGVTLRGQRVWLGGDARRSSGGSAGKATAWTATGGVDRLTPLHLRLSGRGTWYRTPAVTGRLFSGRVAAEIATPVQIELQAGIRSEQARLEGPADRRFSWWGGDLDLTLAGSWYLSLSGNREYGPEGAITQWYSGITWRF